MGPGWTKTELPGATPNTRFPGNDYYFKQLTPYIRYASSGSTHSDADNALVAMWIWMLQTAGRYNAGESPAAGWTVTVRVNHLPQRCNCDVEYVPLNSSHLFEFCALRVTPPA